MVVTSEVLLTGSVLVRVRKGKRVNLREKDRNDPLKPTQLLILCET